LIETTWPWEGGLAHLKQPEGSQTIDSPASMSVLQMPVASLDFRPSTPTCATQTNFESGSQLLTWPYAFLLLTNNLWASVVKEELLLAQTQNNEHKRLEVMRWSNLNSAHIIVRLRHASPRDWN
jgi:hypothetical protein